MKKIQTFILSLMLVFGAAGVTMAAVNAVTPSTNDDNRDKGWAHVNQLDARVGETDLEFVSQRAFWSCFEYRTDGDTSQQIDVNNFNANITDGLYPYFCQNNDTRVETIEADEYVEVRMVFGAETDERFDWTRFDVEQAPVVPTDKKECMKGGWQTFTDPSFRNQGQCVSYVMSNANAGKRN